MVVFLCFESHILQSNLISRQKKFKCTTKLQDINDKNFNGS